MGANHRFGCDVRTALSQADYHRAAGRTPNFQRQHLGYGRSLISSLKYVIFSSDLFDIIALQSRILRCDIGSRIGLGPQRRQISSFDHGSFQDKWKRDSEARVQYIPNAGRKLRDRRRTRTIGVCNYNVPMPKLAIEKLDAHWHAYRLSTARSWASWRR